MKPDWSQAPSWANWLAKDRHGMWWWHSHEPWIHSLHEDWMSLGDQQNNPPFRDDPAGWKFSLEQKPKQ